MDKETTPTADAKAEGASTPAVQSTPQIDPREYESTKKALADTKAELTRIQQSVPKTARERLEALGELRDELLDIGTKLTREDLMAIKADLEARERQAVAAQYGYGVPETVVSELEAIKRQLAEMREQSQKSQKEQMASQQSATLDYLQAKIGSTGANEYVARLIGMEAQIRLHQQNPNLIAPQHVVDRIVSEVVSDFKKHNLVPAGQTASSKPSQQAEGLDGGTGLPTTASRTPTKTPSTFDEMRSGFRSFMRS